VDYRSGAVNQFDPKIRYTPHIHSKGEVVYMLFFLGGGAATTLPYSCFAPVFWPRRIVLVNAANGGTVYDTPDSYTNPCPWFQFVYARVQSI
jgi:hypothetical protein